MPAFSIARGRSYTPLRTPLAMLAAKTFRPGVDLAHIRAGLGPDIRCSTKCLRESRQRRAVADLRHPQGQVLSDPPPRQPCHFLKNSA